MTPPLCCGLSQCSQATSSSLFPSHLPLTAPPHPMLRSPPLARARSGPATALDQFAPCRRPLVDDDQAILGHRQSPRRTRRDQDEEDEDDSLPSPTRPSQQHQHHHAKTPSPTAAMLHPRTPKTATHDTPPRPLPSPRSLSGPSHIPPLRHSQSSPSNRITGNIRKPTLRLRPRLETACDHEPDDVDHAGDDEHHVGLDVDADKASSSTIFPDALASPRTYRTRSRPHHLSHPHTLLKMLLTAATAAAASILLLGTASVRAEDLLPSPVKRHPSYGLSPRQLSKRALPASINDLTGPLQRRATTADITPDHYVALELSPPATCSTLNITWDPSKGTPPFTLAVFVELWFPLAIVTIPADYADPDLGLWMYQVDLPQFQGGPIEVGNTPSVLAAITDSTGTMANTSSFVTIRNEDISCDRDSTPLEFTTWSEGAPSQCDNWHLGWNLSSPAFVGPLVAMILPERQPPVLLSPPENLITHSDGTGGMNFSVNIAAGTFILYSMLDGGTQGSGGMGGKNLVGFNQYSGSGCTLVNPIGLATPTTTAERMTVTPDYTTAVVATTDGMITTISSIVKGGSGSGGAAFSTGSIIGVALGIGAAAGLLIALLFFVFYRRREKRRETHWDMPDGSSDYPKGMPVDRRFAALSRAKPERKKKNSDLVAIDTGTAAARLGAEQTGHEAHRANPRVQSLRGSFRSLRSSAYDYRIDGSREDLVDSPSSSPPTPARYPFGEPPFSDNSIGSAEGAQPLASNGDTRYRTNEEREELIVTNPSVASPTTDTQYKGGSMSSSRGGSSHLASAYRNLLGTPEVAGENNYEEVQLHDRRPSGASSNSFGAREVTYRSASAASNRPSIHSSDGSSRPHFSRGSGSAHGHQSINSPWESSCIPPVPAFPAAYRRPSIPPSLHGTGRLELASNFGQPTASTHRSGNVVIHSDAGLLMDDRLSDEDEQGRADGGEELLELPPQYASLPIRAHTTAGNRAAGAATGRVAGAIGQQSLDAQTLPASAGAGQRGGGGGGGVPARGRGRASGTDDKESETPSVAMAPRSQSQGAPSPQDPFRDTSQREDHMGLRPSDSGYRGRRVALQSANDEDGEETAEQRSERGGTLDRFVGDEDDDAFWLR